MRGSILLGLVNGLSYALLAMGLVLVYKAGRFVNFAHAQLGVLPALLLGKAALDWGAPWAVAFPAAIAVGVALGALVEMTVIRRLRGESRSTLLIATIGVSQVLLALTFWTWLGPDRNTVIREGYPLPFEVRINVDALTLTGQHVLTVLIVPILGLGLVVLLRRTMLGKAIRAVAANPDAAGLAGISVGRISTITWGIAGGLSAVSAILQAPGQPTFDTEALGPSLLLRALGAAALAGFTSLPIAAAAGVALGGLEGAVLHVTQNGGVAEAWMLAAIIVGLLVRGNRTLRTRDLDDVVAPPFASHEPPESVRSRPLFRYAPRLSRWAGLCFGLLAPWLPIWTSSGKQFLLTLVLVHALVAVSLVLLSGWAGQISLGQFAFVGLGAYLGGRLVNGGWTLPAALVAAGLAGAILAVLIGLPALRLAGLTLAVTTLGLAVVGPSWLLRQPWISAETTPTIPPPSVRGIGQLSSPRATYYATLFVLVIALGAAGRLRNGAPGRRTIATRDNPRAVASFGISPVAVKVTTFALSGFLATAAGVLFLAAWRTVSLDLFRPQLSLLSLSIAVVGGISSLAGAVLGAIVVFGLPTLTADWTDALFSSSIQFQLFLGGFGLLATQLVAPGGLASLASRAWAAFGRRVAAELERGTATRAGTATETSPAAALPVTRPTRGRTDSMRVNGASALTTSSAHPALAVRDLRVSFGGIHAVDGVDLQVAPGEIVGLIGANGAGKSTLLNAVAGSIDSDEGAVFLADHDVTALGPEGRSRLGMARTFQDARLFAGLTVRETLQVAASRFERSDTFSTIVGAPWVAWSERRSCSLADDTLEAFGLEPWADHPAATLSTGTRRICDLAAQVVTRPDVLLLDEPAGGVAQREAEQFGPLLRGIVTASGCSLLVVEHDLPLLIGLADRIICMDQGRVIADGPPERIQTDPAVIAAYLGTDATAIARSGSNHLPTARRPRRRRERPLIAARPTPTGGHHHA